MENIKVKQSDFSYDKESITIKFYLNDQPKSYSTGLLTFMSNQLEKFFNEKVSIEEANICDKWNELHKQNENLVLNLLNSKLDLIESSNKYYRMYCDMHDENLKLKRQLNQYL